MGTQTGTTGGGAAGGAAAPSSMTVMTSGLALVMDVVAPGAVVMTVRSPLRTTLGEGTATGGAAAATIGVAVGIAAARGMGAGMATAADAVVVLAPAAAAVAVGCCWVTASSRLLLPAPAVQWRAAQWSHCMVPVRAVNEQHLQPGG